MIVSSRKYKCRKPFLCELSGEEVEKGNVYYKIAQKFEGIFWSIKVSKSTWDFIQESCEAFGNTIEECLDKETWDYLTEETKQFSNER